MEIITIPFEESFELSIHGNIVKIMAFKTSEPGNIKFGIEAPRTVKVNREEIYEAIQQNSIIRPVIEN